MSSTSQSQVLGSKKKNDMISTGLTYLVDLPNQIIVEILSRLPIKTILACRSVCKTWLNLISDPQLSKFHLKRSPVELLLRPFSGNAIYLADLDNNENNAQLKFSAKFCLPTQAKAKADTQKNTINDRDFTIVNSCAGLLCLSKFHDGEPFVICNPITGEFVRIPQPKKISLQSFVLSGFGYCEKTNKYKVVRLSSGEYLNGWMAEVYTLGVGSWRRIGLAPLPFWSNSVVFSNGCIHWECNHEDWPHVIVKFDCEKEEFGVVPPPPSTVPRHKVCLGELRNCLCFCVSNNNRFTEIWVMKDYGVEESWVREYVISGEYNPQPIKYLNNGDLLMFHKGYALVTYNHATGSSKYQEVRGVISSFQAIAHIPSLVSLKDAINMGDSLEMQNINSSCSESQLRKETDIVLLLEERSNPIKVISPNFW